MAKLILTDEEKAAPTYLDWSDSALGKTVKMAAVVIDDEYGSTAATLTNGIYLITGVAHRANADKLTQTMHDVEVASEPAGDWLIKTERLDRMPDDIDVEAILQEWLEDHGYDGLTNPYAGCSCLRDNLAPCGDIYRDCEPARDVDEWHDALSVANFAEERLAVEEGSEIIIHTAYGEYTTWSLDQGGSPLIKSSFCSKLKRWYESKTGEKLEYVEERYQEDYRRRTVIENLRLKQGDDSETTTNQTD